MQLFLSVFLGPTKIYVADENEMFWCSELTLMTRPSSAPSFLQYSSSASLYSASFYKYICKILMLTEAVGGFLQPGGGVHPPNPSLG
jgi:hypothetical protein